MARYTDETRRYALWLHWIKGMSLEEVARRIGCGWETASRWRDEFEQSVSDKKAAPIGLHEFEERPCS